MPTQFSTEAANADHMSEDAQPAGVSEGMPHPIGADGKPRNRLDRTPQREGRGGEMKANEAKAGEPEEVEARPGKDINAAGFVKETDRGKP
jgi:hypothetical protein